MAAAPQENSRADRVTMMRRGQSLGGEAIVVSIPEPMPDNIVIVRYTPQTTSYGTSHVSLEILHSPWPIGEEVPVGASYPYRHSFQVDLTQDDRRQVHLKFRGMLRYPVGVPEGDDPGSNEGIDGNLPIRDADRSFCQKLRDWYGGAERKFIIRGLTLAPNPEKKLKGMLAKIEKILHGAHPGIHLRGGPTPFQVYQHEDRLQWGCCRYRCCGQERYSCSTIVHDILLAGGLENKPLYRMGPLMQWLLLFGVSFILTYLGFIIEDYGVDRQVALGKDAEEASKFFTVLAVALAVSAGLLLCCGVTHACFGLDESPFSSASRCIRPRSVMRKLDTLFCSSCGLKDHIMIREVGGRQSEQPEREAIAALLNIGRESNRLVPAEISLPLDYIAPLPSPETKMLGGCTLTFMAALPSILISYERNYILHQPGDGRPALYYVTLNRTLELVPITDFFRLVEELDRIRGCSRNTVIVLTEKQIAALITSNGGHHRTETTLAKMRHAYPHFEGFAEEKMTADIPVELHPDGV